MIYSCAGLGSVWLAAYLPEILENTRKAARTHRPRRSPNEGKDSMRNIKSLVRIAAISFVWCTAAEAQKKDPPPPAQTATVEYSSAANPSARPLSEFVRVGNMLYLSGKLGTESTGKLAPGGIAAETKQTMENIKAVL